MKVKLAQALAAMTLTGALGIGGFSLAAAQDSTTTAPTDESTTTTEDDSTTTAPSEEAPAEDDSTTTVPSQDDSTEDDSTQDESDADENCPLGERGTGSSEGSGTSASSFPGPTRTARAA